MENNNNVPTITMTIERYNECIATEERIATVARYLSSNKEYISESVLNSLTAILGITRNPANENSQVIPDIVEDVENA